MSSVIPTPDAPLRNRLFVAAMLFVTMPVWWPLFTVLLVCMWFLIGAMIVLMCVFMLGLPIAAILGIEKETTTKFEVEVANDKVSDFKAVAELVGADVEEK